MINLNPIHTLVFAGIVLFIGYGLGRWIEPLSFYSIPAPAVCWVINRSIT